MSSELRKLFEKELQEYFKRNLNLSSNMKVNRNEILIKSTENNSASGDIGFRYLNNANGYILYSGVESPDLNSFFKEKKPPYRSNKPENIVYSMNTSMEIGFKSFSPGMRGTIDLPRNEEERKKNCEWIYTKVKDVYLTRVINLIELKSEAINDVIAHPDYYSYPFLTILYLIKKNALSLDDLNMESILSRKVVGNKSFDKNLLETYL